MNDSVAPQPAPPASQQPVASPELTPPSSPLSPPDVPPDFPLASGETPRAFGAFTAFYQLGHSRNLQAVADRLGESLGTVKNWSSKFNWSERLQSLNSGLLRQHAEAERGDWDRRIGEFREQQWCAAQKLLAAAQCFLESYGDDQLQKMTLSQVSRALRISSQIGQLALTGAGLPEKTDPALSPIQLQLTAALERIYGKSPGSSPAGATQQSEGQV